MSPNKLSADILNNAVKALNILQRSLDLSMSMKENAIGASIESRNVNLGFGLSAIQSNKSSNLDKILVLGKGLSKSIYNNYSYIPITNTETGLKITDLFTPSDVYSDCYIFGSIYLSTTISGEQVYASLAYPVSGSSSVPFVMSRDLAIEDAVDYYNYSTFLTTNALYDVASSIEILKFILSVDYFDGSLQSARVKLYLIDNRKIRTALSFTDENLSFSFIDSIFVNDTQTTRIYNKSKTNIKNIISNWINLSSWDPSFVEYWNNPANVMPEELKTFINNELGIII